jgi:putative aldouronate transport system permease protein
MAQQTVVVTQRAMNRYRFGSLIGKISVNAILAIISIVCLIPVLLVASASLSTEAAITEFGYTLLPMQFSTVAYQFILAQPQRILNAYAVTSAVTVVGTILGLLVMSLLAFAISRQRFALRKPISFYAFFTLLFNGGLIPFYLFVTQTLRMKDNPIILILPYLVSVWNVLLLRTSFQSLPEELLDAARIDGASEWRIFFQVAIPMSTPVLATVALFTMLMYWNDWWMSLLFINNKNFYSIQFLLYNIMQGLEQMNARPEIAARFGGNLPTLTVRMAMAFFAIGPVALAYIFLQKYFIRGITIGSLK